MGGHTAAGAETAGRTVAGLAGEDTADHTVVHRIEQAPAAVDTHPGRTAAAHTVAAHTVAAVAAHTAPGLAAAGDSLGCIDPVGPRK